MSTIVHSGPAHVVASGEVTTFFQHPLNIGLVMPEGWFRLRLEFSADPSTSDVAVRTTADVDGWLLELVNFDRPDGRGTAEPMLLGSVGDDLLFLHFRVFRFGRSDDRTVHYTFFRATRSDVGWQEAAPQEG